MNSLKKIILNNGIPLYLNNNPSLKKTMVNYIVKYGSSGRWFDFTLDGKEHHVISGYAHYLEHLLGERSKYGNLYTVLDERCLESNAYTADTHTAYHFVGMNDIYISIKQLIEAIDSPVFNDRDVDKTRHAIEEEASMWCDKHELTGYSLVKQNLFKNVSEFDDTLSCIGSRKTTKKITTEDLYNCYNAFYADANKALVISGNVNEEELVDFLNNIYANIKPHPVSYELPKVDLAPIRHKDQIIERPVTTDVNGLGIKIHKPSDIDRIKLSTAFDILNEELYGFGSEFYTYLERKKLIDSLGYTGMTELGDYFSLIQTFQSPNRSLTYEAILEKLNKKDMKKEDYELIRKTLIAGEIRSLDDKYERTEEFGYYLPYGEEYSQVNKYQSLSYDEYMQIMSELNFDTYITTQVKKLKK